MPKYGIITAVNFKDEDLIKIYESGFYFISVIDNIANLIIPEGFKPKAW